MTTSNFSMSSQSIVVWLDVNKIDATTCKSNWDIFTILGEPRRERVYDSRGVRTFRVGPRALPDVPRREPPPAQEQRRRGPVEDQRTVWVGWQDLTIWKTIIWFLDPWKYPIRGKGTKGVECVDRFPCVIMQKLFHLISVPCAWGCLSHFRDDAHCNGLFMRIHNDMRKGGHKLITHTIIIADACSVKYRVSVTDIDYKIGIRMNA